MSSSIMHTLYDSKAEFYSAPFFAPNETVATRDFHKLIHVTGANHLKNGKKKGENQKRCHLTQLHQVGNCVVAFATASLTGGVEGLS
jgi:hypothetical protein